MDSLVPANLLDARQAAEAVKGSSVVYFTAGLPPDTQCWETQFPVMLKNALDAGRAAGARFAYFDNTYMYPQDGRLQTKATPFAPVGRRPGVCPVTTTAPPTSSSSPWPARHSAVRRPTQSSANGP